jgi:hypothetical protein
MTDWEDIPMGQLGAAVAIVRALADSPAPSDGEYGECCLCDDNQELIDARGGVMNNYPYDKPEGHDPKCPWRMAVEWVAALTASDDCEGTDPDCGFPAHDNPLICGNCGYTLPRQHGECPACHDEYWDLAWHWASGVKGCGSLVRQPDGEQTDVDPP